jgi:hypothetical protein
MIFTKMTAATVGEFKVETTDPSWQLVTFVIMHGMYQAALTCPRSSGFWFI